jgi:hypothetical protein
MAASVNLPPYGAVDQVENDHFHGIIASVNTIKCVHALCLGEILLIFHNDVQVDAVVNEAFKMANADDGKPVDEAEFKKLLTEILGAVMLQLDGNTISVSSNTVLHEPMATPSSLLSPSPPSPMVSSPSE